MRGSFSGEMRNEVKLRRAGWASVRTGSPLPRYPSIDLCLISRRSHRCPFVCLPTYPSTPATNLYTAVALRGAAAAAAPGNELDCFRSGSLAEPRQRGLGSAQAGLSRCFNFVPRTPSPPSLPTLLQYHQVCSPSFETHPIY